MSSPYRRVFALCLLLLAAPACLNVRPWREQERPWTSETVAEAERVRVTYEDGTRVILKEAAVVASPGVVRGLEHPGGESLEVPLEQIASLETRRFESVRAALNVPLFAVALALMVAAAFVAAV